MKKIFIFLLMIGVLTLNINTFNIMDVKAENDETNATTGSENTDNDDETGSDNQGENSDDTEDDTLKADATLKNITIDGENKVCTKNTTGYVCEHIVRDNDTKSVKITYEPTNSKATVTPEKAKTLEIKEGENKFEVTVKSEDGNKSNTYTFKITKSVMSTDGTLKKISVNGTEVALKDDTTKYTTSVSYGTKKLEIEAIPNDEKATIIDFKNNKASFDFFEASKEIKIKVQSEAGDMLTYTLTVTKRSEADVTLKSLTIKNHKIDFDKEVTDYSIKVLKSVDKLDIEAKATDSKAEVKITNPKLSVGENEVKIEVNNDGNTNTYIIKVTKLDEDDKTLANLKSLTIDNYEIDFKPDKYEYDLEIENENYLVIKAIAKLSEADVEITGNLDLENGSIIKIKVTYDDEFYNTYKINIIKEGSGVIAKNKVSKKGVVAVMAFDVLSIVIIGIVQFVNRNKKKKENRTEDKNKDADLIRKTPKKSIEKINDDIDII
ncbi:MAG: cadherin-like beta sandwich domain-containing protein [Bacilli bacterium]|nr:cadherin-like beta sandwich domain-containing protein [Bacilli bacterium]